MKRVIKKNVILALAAAIMISFMPAAAFASTANAKLNGMYEPTKVVTAAKSYSSIMISWNKVNKAGGYILSVKKSGNKNYSIVKTIRNPSVTSYIITKLSKKTNYKISICPYMNVKGKKKLGAATYVTGYTGLKTPTYVTRVSSSKFITTQWQTYDNAAGIEVYRTTRVDDGPGKYELVASITARTLLQTSTKVKQTTPAVTIKYKDNDIADNSTLYYYKVRSFSTFGRKKVYSSYSDSLHTYAKNTTGKYDTSVLTGRGKTTNVIVKITSDSNNYSTYRDSNNVLRDFGTKLYSSNTAFYNYNGKKVKTIMFCSTNNKNYKEYSKAITLNAGETVYIKLSFRTAIDFHKDNEKIKLGYDYNNHRSYSVKPWKYSQMRIFMNGTNNVVSYYK